MVLTASFALSLVNRAFLPPSPPRSLPKKLASQELDTSVGVSGPHDFSVRRKALSSLAPLASTASRPASVTIANRPSVGRDGNRYRLIWVFGKSEYFCKRGWTRGTTDWPGDLPVWHQVAAWVERLAKPIAVVRTMMGIAEFIIGRAFATRWLRPSCALHPKDAPKVGQPSGRRDCLNRGDDWSSNLHGRATSVQNWARQNRPFLRLKQRPACAGARFSIP